MLERVDRFLGRWVHRGYGLVATLIGGGAVYGGYQIVVVDGQLPGLLLLLPGAAALAYGIWLILTAGRRRLSDLDF